MKSSELKSYIKEQITDILSEEPNCGCGQTPCITYGSVNEELEVSKKYLTKIADKVGESVFAQMILNLRDENVQDEIVSAFEDQYPVVRDFNKPMEEASEKDVENQKAYNAELEKTADLMDKVKTEVDDDAVDKEATKDAKSSKSMGKSRRLDAKIKELKRIEADMKTELNAYKTAEGDDLKNAAKKQLKRLTGLKKETEAIIKKLEGEMV